MHSGKINMKTSALAALALGLYAAAPSLADNWTTGTAGQITSGQASRVAIGGTPATSTPPGQFEVIANTAGRDALFVDQKQASGNIARFRQAGSTKVMISNSGSLGIGTTSPTQKLHVVGNALVTGSIQADGGIKVKAWSMEVPDYVFNEKHKPMALDEVESFVKKNKHLPEIPSAAELKKDGMDMAEMNLRLLKKVEELTLYVIDQNKKIEALSAKVR